MRRLPLLGWVTGSVCHRVHGWHTEPVTRSLSTFHANINLTINHWNESKNQHFKVTNVSYKAVCITKYQGLENVKDFFIKPKIKTKTKTTFLVLEESHNQDPKSRDYISALRLLLLLLMMMMMIMARPCRRTYRVAQPVSLRDINIRCVCTCSCSGSNGGWWNGEYVKCAVLPAAWCSAVWRCHSQGTMLQVLFVEFQSDFRLSLKPSLAYAHIP